MVLFSDAADIKNYHRTPPTQAALPPAASYMQREPKPTQMRSDYASRSIPEATPKKGRHRLYGSLLCCYLVLVFCCIE